MKMRRLRHHRAAFVVVNQVDLTQVQFAMQRAGRTEPLESASLQEMRFERVWSEPRSPVHFGGGKQVRARPGYRVVGLERCVDDARRRVCFPAGYPARLRPEMRLDVYHAPRCSVAPGARQRPGALKSPQAWCIKTPDAPGSAASAAVLALILALAAQFTF